MRPKREPDQPQRELFYVELEQIIDRDHPLVQLGMRIDWASFEQAMGAAYHPTQGAPGISTRLMVALHYLKYQHDLSGENVVAHWVENPYWQQFSGERYFQHRLPIDASSMTRWRQRLGAVRSRTDAARHHRDGDQDGGGPSGATEAHQRGYDGADQIDSLSHRCTALQPLPRAADGWSAPKVLPRIPTMATRWPRR
jgi:hypothetical protein